MNCPKCNDPRAEEIFEEVDIGVGIQKNLVCIECPNCEIIGVCHRCGAFDFQLCQPWCQIFEQSFEDLEPPPFD